MLLSVIVQKKSIFSTSTKIMRSVIFEHTIRKKICAEKYGKIIIKNSFSVHKFWFLQLFHNNYKTIALLQNLLFYKHVVALFTVQPITMAYLSSLCSSSSVFHPSINRLHH